MTGFRTALYRFEVKCACFELDYTVRNADADIGISQHSMDNQAPKKNHLMKTVMA
jgi:hypothetical protein